MSEDSFYARSRAAFAQRFPAVAAEMERAGPGLSVAVMTEGRATDIRVEDREIYGGDARAFAADQVAAYLDRPLRLYMHHPTAGGLVSPVCMRLVTALAQEVIGDGGGEANRYPVDSPTFLVVFGLGLGHHLAELAQRTKARWLILAEPMVEFLAHSCHVVDWAALVAAFEARGGGVHLVTELDPVVMSGKIDGIMTRLGIAYADGSWVFIHYPLWAFTEARRRLHQAIEFSFINRGFYEDELLMTENAIANFTTYPCRLLDGKPRLHRPETVAVVGSGPSLDESFEALHRLRDRVVLFSAGTALRPLLRNGLVPDFHCELENGEKTLEALEEAGRAGDLSQITLLASATIHPAVTALFRDVIFYYRDSVSSTQLLARRHRPIFGTAPTCVNMALTTAAFMGFSEFILFGADCGIRAGADHHARDAVYHDIEGFKDPRRNERYRLEVEGNFGGVVKTDWVLDACRVMLVSSIRYFGLNAVNCSDGALIAGARPQVAETVTVTTPVVDRVALRRALTQSTEAFAPGELLDDFDFATLTANTAAMFADLEALLDRLAAGEPDFEGAYEAVRRFGDEAGERYGRAEAMISGTLSGLPRIALFFGFRALDDAVKARLFAQYMREFCAIATEMKTGVTALFADLAARVARTKAPAKHYA